jgi:hypothetical protein
MGSSSGVAVIRIRQDTPMFEIAVFRQGRLMSNIRLQFDPTKRAS